MGGRGGMSFKAKLSDDIAVRFFMNRTKIDEDLVTTAQFQSRTQNVVIVVTKIDEGLVTKAQFPSRAKYCNSVTGSYMPRFK